MEQNEGSVQSILEDQNFSFTQIDEQVRWLELSKFDNKKFEIFKDPQQLFRLFSLDSDDPNHQNMPIWADVLVRSYKTNDYSWRRARVIEHNSQTNKWRLDLGENPADEFYYDGLNQVSPLKVEQLRKEPFIMADRICFCFDFEDKHQFSERFADANLDRAFKDSRVRYSFYVDAMPKDTESDQPIQRKKRILDRVLRITTDSEEGGAQLNVIEWRAQMMAAFTKIFPEQNEDFFLEQVDTIDKEAEEFYARSVNRVIFDHFCRTDDKGLINKQKLLLPVEEYLPPPVPEKGLIDTMTPREFELEQSILRKNKSLGMVGMNQAGTDTLRTKAKRSMKKSKRSGDNSKQVKFSDVDTPHLKENNRFWKNNKDNTTERRLKKQNKSAEDCIERLGSGEFQQRKQALEQIFLFKDKKAQHIVRLLSDRSITLRQNRFFCDQIDEPLNYFSFKVLQERYANKFKDFLRSKFYKQVFNEMKRKLTNKESVEIKRSKDILKDLLPKTDLQTNSNTHQDESDDEPKFKTVYVLRPKYSGLLKLVNMKIKQELERVMVIGFGKFMRFLDDHFPSKIEVKSLRHVVAEFTPSEGLEFQDSDEHQDLKSNQSDKLGSHEDLSHMFQPCLVSLFLNKLTLNRNKEEEESDVGMDLRKNRPALETIYSNNSNTLPHSDSQSSKTPPCSTFEDNPPQQVKENLGASGSNQAQQEFTRNPSPLFLIETIIHEEEIRILEEPEKFVKLVKLMFEKTFREFYKMKVIKFNLEPSTERSLVTRELIRGLRCGKLRDKQNKEFFFEDQQLDESMRHQTEESIQGDKRGRYVKRRSQENPVSHFWFDRNLKIILRKLRDNARKVKMYVGLLSPLEKLIRFDFRKYLKDMERSQEETVESLMLKIQTCKKEIHEIEEKYPNEIVIGSPFKFLTFTLNKCSTKLIQIN